MVVFDIDSFPASNIEPASLDDISFAISSAELDFLTMVESGVRPPIAFRNVELLDNWIAANSIRVQQIGNRKLRNARVLIGQIHAPRRKLYYRQVWVRARYGDYRKAMVQYVRRTDGEGVKVDRHDVDHAVSSAYLLKQWPDAWVNILFVSSGINRSVGSMMEKILKQNLEDEVLLNAECVIKLFFKRKDKLNRDLVKEYYTEATGRFLSDEKSNSVGEFAVNARKILNQLRSEFNSDIGM
ncbi:hypothetical protein [Pannonibacter phragmitetus]|uniref:hypothetical protein n=1 Tax=Pannonibacter phragmitetus TaxID=121719 RepID=UPI000F0226C7|nr:hypothetical protein [Pannonibacter phragmitetus]